MNRRMFGKTEAVDTTTLATSPAHKDANRYCPHFWVLCVKTVKPDLIGGVSNLFATQATHGQM